MFMRNAVKREGKIVVRAENRRVLGSARMLQEMGLLDPQSSTRGIQGASGREKRGIKSQACDKEQFHLVGKPRGKSTGGVTTLG